MTFLFDRLIRCLLFFIILNNVNKVFAHSSDKIFQYVSSYMCKPNEYFNVQSLTCTMCNSTQNLEPSRDRLSCVCNKRSKFVDFQNGYPKCELCEYNEIPTVDGLDCIACSDNGNNDSCKCSPNEIRLERDINGTLLEDLNCISCPENSYPSPDRTRCFTCRKNVFTMNVNCPCPLVSHLRIREYCVNKNGLIEWPDVRNTYLVKYDGQDVDSYYLRTELQLAVYLCRNGNKTACEHLANICALTLFTNPIPCKVFFDKHNSPLWLYYSKGTAPKDLNQRKITQKYTLDAESNSSRVNIALATFSLNGQFQSISVPNLFCNLLMNIRFAVNIEKSCITTARKLSDMRMEFFEPYLEFTEGDKRLLYALPVLIKNTNKEQIDASQWQLVRRFFLVDTITGIKALPNSMNTDFRREDYPTIIRYIKSMHILIKVQNKEEQGKIFPPLFIVEYDQLSNEQVRQNVEIKIDYKITFILADNDMYSAIEIAIGVLSGLAVAFTAIKAWSYCKRDGGETPNVSTLFWYLIFCCGMLGNVFIFVSFCASVFTFIFYKGQTVLHVLLPSDANEESVKILVIVAFCLKLVEIIALLYQLRNVDIFFIDWEQPRSIQSQLKYDSPRTSLKKLYANRFPTNKRTPLKTPSEIISARRNKTPIKSSDTVTPSQDSRYSIPGKSVDLNSPDRSGGDGYSIGDAIDQNNQQKLPVSIWRTYLIANEWFKIQTLRKANMLVQGIMTLLILEVIDVKLWACPDPDFTIHNIEPSLPKKESFTLKFAVGTLIYLFVHCLQWLTVVLFYDRYIKNHIQEFVDLCSMANISVFILSQYQYGFYIHGRSVHGFADTDLATLIDDLKQEEENLCAHRGLLPGTTEQSFVISMSLSFRKFYDKIMNPNKSNESTFLKRDIISMTKLERNIQTYQKMKQFLSQFIDHCFKDLDYDVRNKQFIEKLLDIEFTNGTDRSIFYIDNNYSFDRVTFYGNEWTLLTFEITLFNFIIALSQDYILAVIIVIFISQFIVICRKYHGKRNLANRTLIDERFLL